MLILIITDIFGLNQYVKSFAKQLVGQTEANLKIVDPYNGIEQNFNGEGEAYKTFINNCGHQNYSEKVTQAIQKLSGDTIVIAFSAGASATWKSMDANNSINKTNKIKYQYISNFIGFYPSQIRNQLDVVPCCPVTLVFPKTEPHFDIEQTIKSLSLIDNVRCFKTSYQHGFMNPLSKNYTPTAESYFVMKIIEVSENRFDFSNINSTITENTAHFFKR